MYLKLKKFLILSISLVSAGIFISSPFFNIANKNNNVVTKSNSSNQITFTSEKNEQKNKIYNYSVDEANINATFLPSTPINAYNSELLSFETNKNKNFQLNFLNKNVSYQILDSKIYNDIKIDSFNPNDQSLILNLKNDINANVKTRKFSLPLESIRKNVSLNNFILSNDYYSHELVVYKPSATTLFDVDVSRIIPDYNLAPSVFLECNYQELIKKISINYTNALPSTVRNTKISIEADDAKGELIVSVDPGAGIKNANNPFAYDLAAKTYTIDGFSSINAKNVLQVSWASTYFSGSFSAKSFILQSVYDGQYMYPSALEMEWGNANNLQEKLFTKVVIPNVQNAPSDFSYDNFLIKEAVYDNNAGTATFSFLLNRYINKSGLTQTSPPGDSTSTPTPFQITITDFKKNTNKIETNLPATYQLTEDDSQFYHKIYDNSMKDGLIDLAISKIINSPTNFSLSSNRNYIDVSLTPYPDTGSVEVSLEFMGIFKSDGSFEPYNYFSKTIVIKGLKSSLATSIDTSNLQIGNPNDIAESMNDAEAIAKDIVYDLVQNPSPTFNVSDIGITSIEYNNKLGLLDFDVVLNKYIDVNGSEQQSGWPAQHLQISGYKNVSGETKFSFSSYEIGSYKDNVHDYADNQENLINLVLPLLENKIQDYSSSFAKTILEIKEDSIITNSEEGKLSFIPVITNYFGDDANLHLIIGQSKELDRIELTGFKKVGQTQINPNANFTLNKSNILASYFIKNNVDDLKQLVLDRVIYQVPNMSFDDIIIGDNSSFSNIEGKITLSVTFKQWYSESGILQTTPSTEPNIVTFYGFKKIKPTTIRESLMVNESNTVASEKIKDINYLKNLVLDNLINSVVAGTTIDNIKISDLASNNLEGEITFKVSLNKYYLDDGNIYDKADFVLFNQIITIKGFANIIPTKLPTETNWTTSYNDLLAENYYNDDAYLKKVVSDRITGSKPNNFNYLTDIVITNNNYDNLLGNVTFDVNLTNYYDDNGNIATSLPSVYSVTLSGFKPISATYIASNFAVPNVSDISPSSLNKDSIIDIIYNNYSEIYYNLPNFYFEKNDIILESYETYDYLGQVEVRISTKTYYNELGQTIIHSTTNPLKSAIVILTGFNVVTETVFNSGATLYDINNIIPTDLNKQEIISLMYKNKDVLFMPIPNSFNQNSITILDREGTTEPAITYDNLNGTITVDISVLNYYNALGIEEDTKPRIVSKFIIKGFKSIAATSIKKTVTLPDVDVGSVLASNITDAQLLTLLNKNQGILFNSVPDNFKIISATIYENSISNIIGMLTAEIKYQNFYDQYGFLDPTTATAVVYFYGFKKVSPTVVKSEIQINNVSNLLPTDFDLVAIKKMVWDYRNELFSSLPDNVSEDQIVISLPGDAYINSLGQIQVNVKLYNYYDEQANIIVSDPTSSTSKYFPATVLLNGFKSISQTTIKESVIVSDKKLTDKYATEINSVNLQQYVFDNIDDIIDSVPEGFTKNDIIIDNNLLPNNSTGIIQARISLSRYYDEYSILQSKPSIPKPIIFEGFKRNDKTTYIKNVLLLSQSTQNIRAHQVDYASFVKYVIQNNLIQNPTPDFNYNTDILNINMNSITAYNLEGYVTAKVSIKNYYNSQGNIVNDANNPLTQTITIYGFEKVQPTQVLSYYESTNFSNQYASDDTATRLLNVVRGNTSFVENRTPSFNYQTNILSLTIDPNNIDNINGTLTATLVINNYYDEKGNIVNVDQYDQQAVSTLKRWTITFAGYKKIYATSIGSTLAIENVNNILPSTTTSNPNLIIDYIYNNRYQLFNELPESGIEKSDFQIKGIKPNNLEGTISLYLELYKYTSISGNLFTKDNGGLINPLKKQVTLTGFLKVYPTSVISSLSLGDLSSNLSNEFPTNVNESNLANLIIKNQEKIIFNNPQALTTTNFTANNITIVQRSNLDGTMTINLYLLNYYDSSGNYIQNANSQNARSFSINITGFNTIGETDAINNYTVKSAPQDKTAQDLSSDLDYLTKVIFENRADIFNNLPTITIDDIKISPNIPYDNLKGTISLKVYLTKYYNNTGALINSTNSSNYKDFTITLHGFKQTSITQFASSYTMVGYEDVSPNVFLEQNKNNLAKIIYDNRAVIFSNLATVNSFTTNSITILSYNSSNNDGKITINYKIDHYYDQNGAFTTEQSELKTLTINGFLKTHKTTPIQYVSQIFNQTASSFVSSDVSNKEEIILEYVYNNLSKFYQNLPTGTDALTINDLVLKTDSDAIQVNDKEGTIKFSLALEKYYDNFGKLKNTRSSYSDFVIGGFVTVPATSVGNFKNTLSSSGGIIYAEIGNNSLTASQFLSDNIQVSNQKILNLLKSNILNTAATDDNKGIVGFKDYIVHNNTITVNEVLITDFYDQESAQLIKSPVSFTIVISGFKNTVNFKIDNTTIILYTFIGITAAIILFIIGFFIFIVIRRKWYKM